MNKYLSILFDLAKLNLTHCERSKLNQFKKVDLMNGIKNKKLNDFYNEPSIPEINFKVINENDNYIIYKYNYSSQIKTENNINDLSIGKLYKNKNNLQNINVIMVHGWRMESYRMEQMFLKSLLNKGYNVYLFTLPYHLERTPDNSYSGEYMISADINRTLISIQQAISDLRSLIKYIKQDNIYNKVVLLGASLGGYVTNLTCAIEKNVDILISVFYVNNLAHSIWNTIPGKYIKKDFIRSKFRELKNLDEFWSIINPSNFKPKISKDKILLFSGIYDKFIDKIDSDELHKSWDFPKRILYKCGHTGMFFLSKKISDEINKFIENIESV